MMKTNYRKQFSFLTDAIAFKRKKRQQGCTVKLVHYLGIASPYREVIWTQTINK